MSQRSLHLERGKRGINAFADLVWPKRCSGCGYRGTWVCDDCLAALPAWSAPWCARCGVPSTFRCHCHELAPAVFRARAIGPHDGWLRQGVHLLKYRDELARAEQFGPMLAAAIADCPVMDVIISVPLHRKREIERGYNQSRLLAEEVATFSGIPLSGANGLVRVAETPHQTGLLADARRRNLAGAFAVQDETLVAGKSVLLMDDVLTTGATINECAATLTRHGAISVSVLTVSRAINDRI